MPYCDNKEIIFLHIPKTGGTTIGNIFDIRLFQDSNPEIMPAPQHLACSMLRERLGEKKYDGYYKFTFVRNPWDGYEFYSNQNPDLLKISQAILVFRYLCLMRDLWG